MLILVELCVDCPAGPACPPSAPLCCALCVGITALYHKAGDDPVKQQAVIKATLGQLYEILDGFGSCISEKFNLDVAKFSLNFACCHAVQSRKVVFESGVNLCNGPHRIVQRQVIESESGW